jgi:hypothetical protein
MTTISMDYNNMCDPSDPIKPSAGPVYNTSSAVSEDLNNVLNPSYAITRERSPVYSISSHHKLQPGSGYDTIFSNPIYTPLCGYGLDPNKKQATNVEPRRGPCPPEPIKLRGSDNLMEWYHSLKQLLIYLDAWQGLPWTAPEPQVDDFEARKTYIVQRKDGLKTLAASLSAAVTELLEAGGHRVDAIEDPHELYYLVIDMIARVRWKLLWKEHRAGEARRAERQLAEASLQECLNLCQEIYHAREEAMPRDRSDQWYLRWFRSIRAARV